MCRCSLLWRKSGEETLCISSTQHWYQSFRAGRMTLVDLQRAPKDKSGCTDNNIAAVRTLIDSDRSITLASLIHQTGLPQTTMYWIIKKDLSLKLHSAKLLPNFLTPCHIVKRFEHCRQMLDLARRRPAYLKHLVTMDEAWCYQYDPLLMRQASQWLAEGEAQPVHLHRMLSIKKVLLVAFFDFKGMIHFEFIRGGTVDTATFLQILGHFCQALKVKRPRRFRYLHMDNAPAHTSKDTRLHLLLTGQRTVFYPALSPDLAPCDFWLFPTIKRPLRGQRFRNLDDVEDAVTRQIGQIPAGDYKDAILRRWPMRWARCVHWNGDYFEGKK